MSIPSPKGTISPSRTSALISLRTCSWPNGSGHTICGELRESHVGQTVILNGWVNTFRTYNDQVFVDLRDRYGITQVVLEADNPDMVAVGKEIAREFVLSVKGKVIARPAGMANTKIPSGKVEVAALAVSILNYCPTPPFEVTEFGIELANEDLRLQYPYLDPVRAKSLQDTLMTRHLLNKTIRDYLTTSKASSSWRLRCLARALRKVRATTLCLAADSLCNEFYALPQSLQLYKQLLMVAGYDKYFQIARCLRDEDRAPTGSRNSTPARPGNVVCRDGRCLPRH